MLGDCYVCVCAVNPLTPALSPKGRGCIKSPLPFGERVRVRGKVVLYFLLLRVKRLFHPAVELLLVGFDPTVHVAFHIRF